MSNNIYRIKGQDLGGTYLFNIERKIKFLFLSFWIKEHHKICYSQKQAEDILPIFLAEKEASRKIKYYYVIEDKILTGNSEIEAIKKNKLKAFL